jgi:undecaprenyl-diphosphatase
MKNKNIKIFFLGVILFLISLLLDKHTANLMSSIKTPFFDSIFSWVTNFITIFVILIFVTTLFLFEEKKREWILPLWLSFIFSMIIGFLLKLAVSRPRPFVEIFYPLIHIPDYSFPSMHAMVAFAVVPILDKEFFNIKWFWISFAFLVSFSRIYLGFHFLSDVVFGAFLGYFIGMFIIYIEERYKPFKRFR